MDRNHHGSRHDRDDDRRKHRKQGRSRSRSPYRHEDRSHKRRRTASPPQAAPPRKLPFRQQPLSKHDFKRYERLFAMYLDVQKEKYIEDLDEREVRGRWKSFVGKWNRGELSEGWYDPKTKERADQYVDLGGGEEQTGRKDSKFLGSGEAEVESARLDDEEDSEDDDFGPAAPARRIGHGRAGPTVPNRDDLELAAEQRDEDRALERADMAFYRKQDRKLQNERLEELVPRSDPGSRERQLEKRREVAATHAGFRDAKEGGEVEVGDSELMGDDGIDNIKRQRKEMERKKNEREIRKEEQLRARMAEREERLQKHREKEDKTMEYLKALAKERFG